jgi:anti-sigma regulatory factor (Ser/Thr protein kinase)
VRPTDQEQRRSMLHTDGVPAQSWTLTLESGPHASIRGTRSIAAWAMMLGIGPACRARIATACAEIIDNVNTHAYPNTTGEITISASKSGRDLHVSVEDLGIGLNRRPSLDPKTEQARSTGLTRAASLCESLEVDSIPTVGTCVELTFCIYQVFFDGQDQVDLSDLDYLPPATARALLERIRTDGDQDAFYLSPALTTTVGRLLIGPDDCRTVGSPIRS